MHVNRWQNNLIKLVFEQLGQIRKQFNVILLVRGLRMLSLIYLIKILYRTYDTQTGMLTRAHVLVVFKGTRKAKVNGNLSSLQA